MTGSFVDLYPDELLYSGLARYADWMDYPTRSALGLDLFGARRIQPILDLPNRLDYLLSILPPGHQYTTDEFIDHHTLLPFYAPFLPADRVERVRQIMCSDGRGGLYATIGLLSGKIPAFQTLRFCPVCADEDRQHYGEIYWHRLPHVPGVEVCPTHKVWLEDTQISFQGIGHQPLFMSADRAIRPISPRPLDLAEPAQAVLLAIAQNAAWLLDQSGLTLEREDLRWRYVACLFEQNLSTYNGRLRLPQLFEALQQIYPDALLSQLHCELNPQIPSSWPLHLVRPSAKRAAHPLYHILMTHFLGHTLESLWQQPSERSPFGDGPWPCLNPAADHYQQPQISTCQIRHRKPDGLPVGTFTCECGFSYTRIGPDRSLNDRLHYGYVNATGPVWDELFQQLWYNPEVNTKALHRRLNMSWKTLRKHAARLGLSFPPPGFRLTKATPPLPACSDTPRPKKQHDPTPLREVWMKVMAQHPDKSTTQLRRLFPYEYDWLFQYDREWFDAHRPAPTPRTGPSTRIDWEVRDAKWATKVEEMSLRLKNTPGKPFRISRSLLEDTLGLGPYLYDKTNRLPRTLQALHTVAESPEDFAIRRVVWYAEQFRQEGRQPTRYQLASRAGVDRGSLFATSLRVQATLDAALQSFQSGANS